MTRDWHIGDPIDYSNDGWMDAQNWVPDRVYYIKDDEADLKHKEFIALSDKAWQLYEERKYEEALSLINKALSYDDGFFNVWNRKAIILQDLKRYEESKESFDREIALHSNIRVVENKAIMLRIWANELYFNSKDLQKAEMLVNEVISEASNLSTTEIDIENYKNFAKDIRDRIEAINMQNWLNLNDNIYCNVKKRVKSRDLNSFNRSIIPNIDANSLLNAEIPKKRMKVKHSCFQN